LAHADLTVGELRREFGLHAGVKLSRSSVLKYLKEAGITRSRRSKDAPVKGTAEGDSVVEHEEPVPVVTSYTTQHRDAGDESRYPHGLTDAEWDLVSELFQHTGPGRPPRYERRAMLDACLYVVRSGCPWRMLPRDMPPWQCVYAQFRRWSEAGVFEETYDRLRAMWREREGRVAEPTATIIDAQSVKNSPQGGPKGYDAGKKVKGRKRHLATDTIGLLLVVMVTVASVQDRDAAEPLVAAAKQKVPTLVAGFADGGYAGRAIDRIRQDHGVDIKIVRHPGNRNVGRWRDA
jgi:transposase